jgi:hypothetical protein
VTGFFLSLEQLRSAPPEVRRWIEHEVAASLAALAGPPRDLAHVHAASLAACQPEEALQLFELIKGDFLLSQIFFELGREVPTKAGSAPLHAIPIADLLRHTRLADGARLADYLSAINRAFQAVRNDPEASLFGFDQAGHVYIHETTHRSIRQVWEHLFAASAPELGTAGGASGPAGSGFVLPRLGPSEEIAAHAKPDLPL